MSWRSRSAIFIVAALVVACSNRVPPRTEPDPIELGELWVKPGNVAARDLRDGAGGAALSPDPEKPFDLIVADDSGFSPGYLVRDSAGVEWNVKLGVEAQSEVVLSRVLWALGYHQPPIYLLKSWHLRGAAMAQQPTARFRRESHEQRVTGDWSWSENPFVSTQAFRGLLVVNVLFNNWDLKTSNNKIYDTADPRGERRRTYVVRDLGASLGKTTFPRMLAWTPLRKMPQGSRNSIDDFEEQRFIRRVDGTTVTFDYRSANGRLLDAVTVADVVWVCRLMSGVTDAQWRDAFRAAAYPDDVQSRFIAKVKAKIGEGLALEGRQGS